MYVVASTLKLVPIEGAETLQLAYFGGLPFAVSKDVVEGKLYAVFLPDGRISEEYATANDLVSRGVDRNGKKLGGFFGASRKVRSIKLMKGRITSVGYVADLESLAFTGVDISTIAEGDDLDTVNGVPIATKFVNDGTLSGRHSNRPSYAHIKGIKEHPSTDQVYKIGRHDIPLGALVIVSGKMDGVSGRVGNVYITKPVTDTESNDAIPAPPTLSIVAGSRRVLMEQGDMPYTEWVNCNYYTELAGKLSGMLLPGETIYGEIVGWKTEQSPLFVRGGMVFKYGCKPGERKFYVYNIKWTLPDGSSVDLSWDAIKERCLMLGLPHVLELERFVFDGNLDALKERVYSLADGDDWIDPSHIREGVVLRVESGLQAKFYKAKSPAFYALEDIAKNDPNYIDAEEAA